METETLTIRMPRNRRPYTSTSVGLKEEASGKLMRAVCGLLSTGISNLSYRRFEPEEQEIVGYVTYEPSYSLVRDFEEDGATDISSQVAMLWDELPILFEDPEMLKIDNSGFIVRETRILRKETLLTWYESLESISKQSIPGWESASGGRFPVYVCAGEKNHHLDLPPLLEIRNRRAKIISDIWPVDQANEPVAPIQELKRDSNEASKEGQTASCNTNDINQDADYDNVSTLEKPKDLPMKRKVTEVRIIGAETLYIADDGKRYRLTDSDIKEHIKTRLMVEGAVSASDFKVVDVRGKKHFFEAELEFPDITDEDDG